MKPHPLFGSILVCVLAAAAAYGCGKEEDQKVSEAEAVAQCEATCEASSACDEMADLEACRSLCGLAGIVAACDNGREILDHQADCDELACDEQSACYDEGPACAGAGG